MKKVSLGNSGIEVSRLCLGTMYFGSRIQEQEAFALMDQYREAGGSFLDTSNNYCFWLDGFIGDESELTLGKWMRERRNRDDVFLATKCGVRPIGKDSFEGLSPSAIKSAIEGSLKRLRTDHVDLYYIHVDWRESPLEETLGALHDLVEAGKVGNIACSNMTAWRLVQAKEISRRNGWPEFVGIQNRYSYLKPRDKADLWVQKFVSDDLLDYCETENDTAILAYTSTLGGLYSWNSIYERNHPALNDRFFSEDNERRLSMIQRIADNHAVSPFQVVFAWMLKHKATIIPILGVRTRDQLADNLASLKLSLSDEEFERMNNAAFNGKTYQNEGEVSLLA